MQPYVRFSFLFIDVTVIKGRGRGKITTPILKKSKLSWEGVKDLSNGMAQMKREPCWMVQEVLRKFL